MSGFNLNDKRIRLHGRNVTSNSSVKFIWSYSGFSFSGRFGSAEQAGGDGRSVLVADCEVADGGEGLKNDCMLTVFVDGERSEVLVPRGRGSVVIASVACGEHTVSVRKSTEPSTCSITFYSIAFDGELAHLLNEEKKKVEFIGDSVSCGVGAFPSHRKGIPFNNALHCDEMCAFPALTARRLGVEANVIAIAGWGVTRGSEAEQNRLPDVYEYVNGYYDRQTKWDFSSFRPDCVVIELGANDGGHTENDGAFRDAVLKFLKTVKDKYNDAPIVWVTIAMNSVNRAELDEALELFRAEFGEESAPTTVELEYDSRGEINHPCAEAQEEYARKVSAAVSALLAEKTK